MSSETKTGPSDESSSPQGLIALVLIAGLVGMVSGLVATLFRLSLERLDHGREVLVAWAHGFPLMGFLLVVGAVAGAAGLSAWLVKRFSPQAGGSGIPQAEAIVLGQLPLPEFRLVPVKFLGGCLSIGGGLALGREGPSVQMATCFATVIGRWLRRSELDLRVLLSASAGAGLATAFNAPLAGAIFVFEELLRRFDARVALAALAASGGAISVARVFLGTTPDFVVPALPTPGLEVSVIFAVFGFIAGLAGVAYQRAMLGALAVADRCRRWPPVARAATIGAGVGAVAWFAPGWIGDGDALTQRTLDGTLSLAVLPVLFVFRFLLAPVCYAAGTPGGIFSPMLVIGAQMGVLFAAVAAPLSGSGVSPTVFAVVGMAAFFTGVVRAPLTGIVLVTEMTGSFNLLLPMLVAGAAAMLGPALVGARPIYDVLKERALALEAARRPEQVRPDSSSETTSVLPR